MLKQLVYFFLLAIAVSGIFFYSCSQEQSTSANKAWIYDKIADSLLVERLARGAADLLKINISDSASYFYKRAYLDAVHASKLNKADTTGQWAPAGSYQSPISNISDTSKYVEYSDSLYQWYQRAYIDALLNLKLNITDTSAFTSDALVLALLAYRIAYSDTSTSIAMQWELDGKQNKGTDTLSYSWGIMDTVTTGDLPGWKVPTDITIIEVAGYTDANTTTFNLEERAEATPNTAGTDVMTSDMAADVNQQEAVAIDFANAAIAKDSWLVPTISATGDVAIFSITVRYVKVY